MRHENKLSHEDCCEIARQYRNGRPMFYIARDYGVHVATCHHALKRAAREKPLGRTYNDMRKRPIVYPEIEKWMRDNGMDIKPFARYCGLSDLYRFLTGMIDNPHMSTLDAIVNATGLSYETAFRRTDKEDTMIW